MHSIKQVFEVVITTRELKEETSRQVHDVVISDGEKC